MAFSIVLVVVGAIMATQAVFVLTVAPTSATGGLISVVLRSATYLFIASLVGHFASRLRRVALHVLAIAEVARSFVPSGRTRPAAPVA